MFQLFAKSSLYFFTLFFLAFSACHSGAETENGFIQNDEKNKSNLYDRVRLILEEARSCKEDELCYNEDYFETATWSPEDYGWFPEGPRVLIVDVGFSQRLLLGRYKKRILDLLKVTDEGEYISSPRVQISGVSKFFLQISNITGTAREYVSAQMMQNLFSEEDLGILFDENLPVGGGHSLAAISIIGEYVPSSSLMLAEPASIPNDIFCKKDLGRIRIFSERAGNSLVQKIKENNIDYINISGGEDISRFQERYRQQCNGILTIEDASAMLTEIEPFYKILDDSGVLLFQASPNELWRSDRIAEVKYPLDCSMGLQNRVRVHYGLKGQRLVPQKGVDFSNNSQASSCVDAYVTYEYPSSKSGGTSLYWSNGFRWEPVNIPYSSWMAPVLTAYVASKHSSWSKLSTSEIKDRIFQGRNKILLDPLGHKLFEAYRWNVLD